MKQSNNRDKTRQPSATLHYERVRPESANRTLAWCSHRAPLARPLRIDPWSWS